MTSEAWIVARTKLSREKWAVENIARQGFEYYFPVVQELRVNRSGGSSRKLAVARPLFPSYLFVQNDAKRWRALLSTFGLVGILMTGDKPAIIPLKEMAKLRALEDDSGFIVLPNAPMAGARFKRGQRVGVVMGALNGCTGVYEGQAIKDRVKVLLDFIGHRTPVLIQETFLEAV